MSKHTPGPWFMTKELPGYRSRISSTPQNLGWDLAHVCNGPEADANARLIAAAPELLEALRALMENYEIVDGLGFNMFAVTKALRAIKKATGCNK